MRHVIYSLESLEYKNLFPCTKEDRDKINLWLFAEVPVYYTDNDYRVYNEAGIWIAELELRSGGQDNA